LHRCHRFSTLGQPALAVLAVVISVHRWVDGRKPFHRNADRALWCCVADGCHCLLPPPEGDYPNTRTGLDLKESDWARLEGQTIASAIYRSDRCYSACLLDCSGDSRYSRLDLAD